MEVGVAGQRCALNLAGEGVSKDAIERGDVILSPALRAPSDRIDALLQVLPTSKPVTTWFPARLHSHAVEVGARIVPLAGNLSPGRAGFVQVVLERPIAAAGDGGRFVLRDTSASRSLGGGRIFIDLRAPARKRGTPQRLLWLEPRARWIRHRRWRG